MSVGASLATTTDEPTDAELIDRVRNGEHDAYALLYERHVAIAKRLARSILSNASETDDVVSEVFAAILSALERGNGPAGTFLPYLLSSVRNECYRANRRQRREPADHFGVAEASDENRSGYHHDPSRAIAEAAVVRTAFESLPTSFQEVLWRTEVDDASPGVIAATQGATAGAVATTLLRARRALASAYLQQHLGVASLDHEVDAACRAARPLLADYVRGSVRGRQRRRLEEHLDRCEACDDTCQGLGRVNRHLRSVPFLPLNLGTNTTLGIKAQVMSWFESAVAPLATTSAVAVATLAPSLISDNPLPTSAAPVVADSVGFGVPRSASIAWVTQSEPTATSSRPAVAAADSPSRPGPSSDPMVTADPPASQSSVSTIPSTVDTIAASPPPIVASNTQPLPDQRPRSTGGDPSSLNASELTTSDASSDGREQSPGTGPAGGPPQQDHPGNGHAGSPPGLQDNPGTGPAGGPPQQDHPGNGHAGSPPGLQDNPGTGPAGGPPQQDHPGNGHAGSPPGLQDNPGNGHAGSPPGLQDNPGNGHAGSPPGLQDNPGNGHAGSPPGLQDNPGNGHAGSPPPDVGDDPVM